MRQLQTFQGTGISAHLFYESKVAEALSFIIEKSKEHKGFTPSGDLSKDDLINLDAVKSYINDHFAFDIKADHLTRIACMGQTKLRYSFKKCYVTISQIAQAVGYHHSGRFASLFRSIPR